MGLFAIKLPDVGEGIAEAELVEWKFKIGDAVQEDDVLAAVMTDKVTVEIPSVVAGTIVWTGGDIGDVIAVGAELVRIEVDGEGNVDGEEAVLAAPSKEKPDNAPEKIDGPLEAASARQVVSSSNASSKAAKTSSPDLHGGYRPVRREGEKPLASPSVRLRARESGVDLRKIKGSGPGGRITHEDLNTFFGQEPSTGLQINHGGSNAVTEVKVVGLRRQIAERMVLAKTRIPHITIVEEVDVTELENLRAHLNNENADSKPRLTPLPFLMQSIVRAVREQPAINAHFDDEVGVLKQYGGVHIGIATQTPGGLMVPTVRHAEAIGLWGAAAEVGRLSEAARNGKATRNELTGSTITLTSLGMLGALATTPIINYPEVAIVGVNRMAIRPSWSGTEFVPRKMMNISCSFDHRVIDGWDAAVFVKRLKELLERPALIFVESQA